MSSASSSSSVTSSSSSLLSTTVTTVSSSTSSSSGSTVQGHRVTFQKEALEKEFNVDTIVQSILSLLKDKHTPNTKYLSGENVEVTQTIFQKFINPFDKTGTVKEDYEDLLIFGLPRYTPGIEDRPNDPQVIKFKQLLTNIKQTLLWCQENESAQQEQKQRSATTTTTTTSVSTMLSQKTSSTTKEELEKLFDADKLANSIINSWLRNKYHDQDYFDKFIDQLEKHFSLPKISIDLQQPLRNALPPNYTDDQEISAETKEQYITKLKTALTAFKEALIAKAPAAQIAKAPAESKREQKQDEQPDDGDIPFNSCYRRPDDPRVDATNPVKSQNLGRQQEHKSG